MTGSTPERRISFLPLESGVMAMAVSPDDFAAQRLAELRAPSPGSAQIHRLARAGLHPPACRNPCENLPEGCTRTFATLTACRQRNARLLEPEGESPFARQTQLSLCGNEQDAAEIASPSSGRITAHAITRRMIRASTRRQPR